MYSYDFELWLMRKLKKFGKVTHLTGIDRKELGWDPVEYHYKELAKGNNELNNY